MAMLLLFRKGAKKLFAGTDDLKKDYIGERVKVEKTIPIDGEGTIIYRSSGWIAFSDHKEIIQAGDTVEIIAMDGIRVKVKPIQ